MKKITIEDQPILSFGRTVRIAVDGIRYRLFRSAVTVAVVAVAIAFLMNVLSESLIKRAVAVRTQADVKKMRLAASWESRLARPDTVGKIIESVSGLDSDATASWDEALRMAPEVTEGTDRFRAQARESVVYLEFFKELPYGKRRRLVGAAEGVDTFDRLQGEPEMARFESELAPMKSVRMPKGLADFQDFIKAWPGLRAFLETVQAGQDAAIGQVRTHLGNRSLADALTDADFVSAVTSAGFALDPEAAKEAAHQVKIRKQSQLLDETLRDTKARRSLARRFNRLPTEITVDHIWDVLGSRDGAAWYLAELKDQEVAHPDITADEAVMLAEIRERQKKLTHAERVAGTIGKGPMGLDRRMAWLVLVSMVVCAVGICNAMLMSVTERFREIATLKCLGALDRFIMLMFVLEAGFLGVVGGLIGATAGMLIGIARMISDFGWSLALSVEPSTLLATIAQATGLGILLAMLAAVGPSLKAARLAPMEAMRIE